MIFWSHRGYVNDTCKENTIASLKNAYENGYRNIELDIWYLDGKLILKHNEPTKEEREGDKLTTLKEFLSIYKNELYYWMDFKNLNESNIDQVLNLYREVLNEIGISYSRIQFTPYEVNWEKSILLAQKASSKLPGINCMFIQDDESFNENKVEEYYEILRNNSIKFLSIYNKFVTPSLIEKLDGIKLFVWTVDEKEELDRLEVLGIENICTNVLLPNQ